MPGSHIPKHVSRDSRIPPASALNSNFRPTLNINTDVTNRLADNQLHPVTILVTYQKVPFPDFAKSKRKQTFKKISTEFIQILKSVTLICGVCSSIQMMPITLFKSVSCPSQISKGFIQEC